MADRICVTSLIPSHDNRLRGRAQTIMNCKGDFTNSARRRSLHHNILETQPSTSLRTAMAKKRLPASWLTDDPLWYKDAIFYEVHVRAFHDSNADGIGDFRGLLEKLDYLQDLGVTALWLLPFYPSPLRDDGYDIANYNDIN